jgi:TDG/mug DNA glycosylase family protein
LRPDEQAELPRLGLGITNLVPRVTATAAELSDDELRAGGRRLERIAAELAPAFVAFLGLTTYRTAFGRRSATVGEQDERLADSRIWVLPNPRRTSGSWSRASSSSRSSSWSAWPRSASSS